MADALIQRLSEERQKVWSEYRTDLEAKPAAEWTPEDRQKFDRMSDALDDLDKRIKVLNDNEDREAALASREDAALRAKHRGEETSTSKLEHFLRTGDGGTREGGKQGFDIDLRGIAGPKDGFEQRTLSVSADPTLVPTEFAPQLYRYLIQNSAIRQTNVRVITTSNGDSYVMPTVSAWPSEATIVAEAGAIGTNDPTFGSATLSAYKFAFLWQVTNELIQDSAYNILGELAFEFGRQIANGTGKKFVVGTGSSEPAGVVTKAGTVYQYVGGTPAANGPTYNDLVETMHKVIPPYRQNSYWMFNDLTLKALRELKDGNQRPLWQPGLAGFGTDVPDTIFGKPYVIDPYMPNIAVGATSIAYGDFSGFLIREVADLRLERSDDYAFNQDVVTFRAIYRCDSALLDTHGAIATYKGGTA